MRESYLIVAVMLGMTLMLTACSGNTGMDMADDNADIQAEDHIDIQEENKMEEEAVKTNSEERVAKDGAVMQTEMKMNVKIGDYNFTATLENNTAVEELLDMLKDGPITIQMDDYSGFEKVGPLERSLTTSNSQIATSAGDIVLYNGNNIVMFYGSNSWNYTRIGKIDDLSEWEKALGNGSITVVFTLAE